MITRLVERTGGADVVAQVVACAVTHVLALTGFAYGVLEATGHIL